MKGEIQMSCPYLEKGRMTYCRAPRNERLRAGSSEFEGVCFSGEFSGGEKMAENFTNI
jgi:hypothetical protein